LAARFAILDAFLFNVGDGVDKVEDGDEARAADKESTSGDRFAEATIGANRQVTLGGFHPVVNETADGTPLPAGIGDPRSEISVSSGKTVS
jgi:hypothetical protein